MKELCLVNLLLREPYNIYLCNFDETDQVSVGLLSAVPDYPWNVTYKCFTELFPRDNLVYMTPDSPNVASGEFRFDDIFILGACVDVRQPTAVSYERAKK